MLRPEGLDPETLLNDSKDEARQSEFPGAEESLFLLHRAGWTVACTAFLGNEGRVWIVSGYNGENQVLTASTDRDEAWWHACIQARSVGMLGRLVSGAKAQ
jgi:hypothetical protein